MLILVLQHEELCDILSEKNPSTTSNLRDLKLFFFDFASDVLNIFYNKFQTVHERNFKFFSKIRWDINNNFNCRDHRYRWHKRHKNYLKILLRLTLLIRFSRTIKEFNFKIFVKQQKEASDKIMRQNLLERLREMTKGF